jgi:hypothetical protein
MAAKKTRFPSKACPNCGALIHARSKKHLECGWVMDNGTAPITAVKKKVGRPKKQTGAKASLSGISLDEISAVKALVERMGADKVRQLASVLAK